MDDYIGLDVSMKETAVSIRRDGKRIWRGKCASDPKLIANLIRKRAPMAKRVVFETGPLSVWFYHALTEEGLPAICIDARHAKAALDMAANKTDPTMRMAWPISQRPDSSGKCGSRDSTACSARRW
jgi:transposase